MSARKLNCALAEHGKLESDGRPPLKLDSRDLLDIVRNTHPDAFLIPALIWTPWFAALGSKSGFDSIEECYGDLAKHIFALETGLSSDPSMNARMFQLDRFQMVSNSDDHSPQKIGREANVFDTGDELPWKPVSASAVQSSSSLRKGNITSMAIASAASVSRLPKPKD